MAKLSPDKGLRLEPDNTPLSGSMVECATLIDEVLYTSATGKLWYFHYAYGLDLASAQTVASIICRAALSNTPSAWYSAAYDSVTVYKSDDGSSWTEVEQFDGPPIIYTAYQQMAFELEFASPQTARFFKVRNTEASSTLATTPGGASLLISEIEAYSSGAQTMLQDASLDLSAYGRNLENLQAFLRAHDGIELHDIQAALAAYSLSEEDFAGWLGAFFEDKSDLGAILETWATQYKDLAGDFDAKGQSVESLMSRFETAKAKYKNLAAFLSVTGGDVLKDLAAFLSVTDGSILKSMGLELKAIHCVPAFRSITAQRVSSVIQEVSS